jgi:UDP-glucose 4-epimerase
VVGSAISEFGDNSMDNLVPKVFSALKSGNRPEIYGASYPTPDGTCIRDYIHVQDLAKAHIAALKRCESDFTSAVYNVGSGIGYSVKEMMAQISETLGRDINPQESPARAGDSPKLIASIEKIESELGWKPVANLKEMIDSSWDAERSNS